jgi:hypothetical protein
MSAEGTPVLDRIPRRVLWTRVARVTAVALMAGLVWLVLWSYFGRFLPIHQQYVEKITSELELANEVQQLVLKWDALDAAQTDTRFKEAKGSLFGSAEECAVWLEDRSNESLALALKVTPKLGNADGATHTNLGLALFPATLQIQPTAAPGFSNGPYHRLLGFARAIEQSAKRADILELTVTGQSNSVEQASAVFQLWSESSPPPK